MDRIYLTLCPVRLTHFLPSGRYQLAMVPYRGRAALAPPSCSPALERLDLGQHALSVILGRAGLGAEQLTWRPVQCCWPW